MKVLVIGSGGREHAICTKFLESKTDIDLYCLPGNGATAKIATNIAISATDINAIVDYSKKENIDLVFVAPDDPLSLGLVDELEKVGIRAFGPNKEASQLESSKVFSKNFMKKHNIPTAKYQTFSDFEKAKEFLVNEVSYPIVIKVDGLALGKGVFILDECKEAIDVAYSILEDSSFGRSGNNIVIEEFLDGKEVSILAFTDSKAIKPMISSTDYKKAKENDEGLNTGGMGSIAPSPFYTKDIEKECIEKVFLPTIQGLQKDGIIFKGIIYFGLILTKDGVKVLEYNARFGDPETQVVLPLMKNDILEVVNAIIDEKLEAIDLQFKNKNSAIVIACSNGYPQSYKKGFEISGLENVTESTIYHAGTTLKIISLLQVVVEF